MKAQNTKSTDRSKGNLPTGLILSIPLCLQQLFMKIATERFVLHFWYLYEMREMVLVL